MASGLAVEALRITAVLLVLYAASLFVFNPGCFGDQHCRSWSLREGIKRSLPGIGASLLLWLSGRLIAVGEAGLATLTVTYATVVMLLFAFYDSVAMFLINAFASLAIRREAGVMVRARLLVEAATPFYWLTFATGLFLVVLGDEVVQPRSTVPVLAGGLLAAAILYIVGRAAWDRWVWTYRYLEAVGEGSPILETLRSLMRMARLKPLIALAVALAGAGLGSRLAGYAFYLGAFLYTLPVYRVVSLYVKYAFARGETMRAEASEVIGPEAVEAARSLYYSTILSIASTSIFFAAIPVAVLSARSWPAGLASALAYAGGIILFTSLHSMVRRLNVLAPLAVELSRVLAGRLRALISQYCTTDGGDRLCCELARAGCLAGGGLARGLVEEACRG